MEISKNPIFQNEIDYDGKTIYLYFNTIIELYVSYGFGAYCGTHCGRHKVL